ncbi:hypothetical protein [Streptomyces sp. NPDC002790]|uniref:hypothetical protein n=1 Tax=Streptomyces sp. NPDC002790 TaxID=3154431 RepID=UPI003320D35C
METVLVIIALLFVVFLAFGGYVTVKAVGAAKRGVDRKVEQARRAVEDTTLRARSYVQPGAAAELAQLRLHLRTSMRATQDALHARVAEDSSLKESLGLFERLSAHGHEVDAELKRMESEPDKEQVARVLPELRTRTERITRSADALRHAARDRAGRFASDDLDALSSQIDLEAGALRHWTTEPAPGAESGAESEPGAAREAPRTDRGQRRDRERNRAAITPPGVRPAYPWEKKPRPESTT